MSKKERAKHLEAKKKKSKLFTIIELMLLVVIIYSGYKIVCWIKDNNNNNIIKNELENVVKVEKQETADNALDTNNYDIDFNILKSKNSDTVRMDKIKQY